MDSDFKLLSFSCVDVNRCARERVGEEEERPLFVYNMFCL